MKRVHFLIVAALSLGCLALADTPATRPAKPDDKTRAAYENFKSLAGKWEGKSTKGWTELLDISIMAKGSCVLETSKFAHGPDDDGMATMYHLDGPNLLLTHYCMAGNQPRLRATEISDDGKRVLFEFQDATNLASRDVGHMDKVVVQFIDDTQFRSQWTFYAKGKEQWMEEISFKRLSGPTTRPASSVR